jgi:hypothetical protein
MKQIIHPIDKKILEKELSEDKFLRKTNYGNNKIYIVTSHNAPNVMLEIGRLRELTFREAGGGTGKEVDIDEFDTMKDPYIQLIVWDSDHKEILGGYRYFDCSKIDIKEDIKKLATAELFHFSDTFLKNYMPYTIELGRSFVQPQYQSTRSRKVLFALDNLWDGLGAIVIQNKNIKYFFGKVTMYTHYNQHARDYVLFFLNKYFGDKDNLVKPIHPLKITTPEAELNKIFSTGNYDTDYKILSQRVRSLGENIPPLINSYMNISPTMKMFGTALNPTFGMVEESGIMVTIADIYQAKAERHISSYFKEKQN